MQLLGFKFMFSPLSFVYLCSYFVLLQDPWSWYSLLVSDVSLLLEVHFSC